MGALYWGIVVEMSVLMRFVSLRVDVFFRDVCAGEILTDKV